MDHPHPGTAPTHTTRRGEGTVPMRFAAAAAVVHTAPAKTYFCRSYRDLAGKPQQSSAIWLPAGVLRGPLTDPFAVSQQKGMGTAVLQVKMPPPRMGLPWFRAGRGFLLFAAAGECPQGPVGSNHGAVRGHWENRP